VADLVEGSGSFRGFGDAFRESEKGSMALEDADLQKVSDF
jgi:hypothetical protein